MLLRCLQRGRLAGYYTPSSEHQIALTGAAIIVHGVRANEAFTDAAGEPFPAAMLVAVALFKGQLRRAAINNDVVLTVADASLPTIGHVICCPPGTQISSANV